ncbi:MAG: GNAT family N-acetyltransferase [Acidimicrobiales bacterium]|nr:GNAT family N-acetyltransferase [Acidimicrobiales bacterium]
MSAEPERWGRERLDDVVSILDEALPEEGLLADEIEACLFDDPDTFVLGLDRERAVAAVAIQRTGAGASSFVAATLKLLAVVPSQRRKGFGRLLLTETEHLAARAGATEMRLTGAAPFYFWPGVDVCSVGMLCLAEAAGYRPVGAELNMSLPVTFRAPCPAGVEIRRVLDDQDADSLFMLVRRAWPWWEPEVQRAVEQATCLAAFATGTSQTDATESELSCRGFVCHSVNRAGWLGPMGADPADQRRGLGSALLGEACRDLMVANFREVEISWVGPVRFYAKAGATVSRVFRTFAKPLS